MYQIQHESGFVNWKEAIHMFSFFNRFGNDW